ncbi:MAG: hypothetical protein JW776_13855 [Candidatus Lokiarchaeota archaeon]|nr:hypothetical protein [Candidatus Lokiarchaeota archaeon]
MEKSFESKSIIGVRNKFGITIIGALLFGIGWHIRGSGTSDPTVAMLLLLLFLSIVFGPRKKFNPYIFGVIVILFRVLRRGWGTLVGQAGIPWVYPGVYDRFGIIVPWWYGYFWLFVCGIAWSTLAALFLGGYMFSRKNQYTLYDFWLSLVIFIASWVLGILIARAIIPHISPLTYQVYINGLDGTARNYKAMRDNFAVAFAIIPVLIYLGFAGKECKFVGDSLMIMIFFGIGFSIADVWQAIGRNNLDWGLPFWSLWEYFTGFVIGILVMIFYYRKTRNQPQSADIDFPYYPKNTMGGKILTYLIAHLGLFLFGIQESLRGGLNGALEALGIGFELETWMGILIILLLDIPLYTLYQKGLIFRKFKQRSFPEKSIIWLISLLPFYMTCYLARIIISGTLFPLNICALVTYIDIVSFIIVETYLIINYIQHQNH